MRSKTILPSIILAVLCGTVAVSATPSTQIWIPSTDIQPFMNPHWGFDSYLGAYNTGGPLNGNVYNAGLTIGLLPPKTVVGLEVGIDYRDISGNHRDPVLFNAKIGLPENAFFKYMPAIALGIYDIGPKDPVTDYNVAYGLAAKNIGVLGRFSAGGYRGMGPDGLWNSSKGNIEKSGVLASWDRTIKEISDKLWLAVDYQSGMNGYGALSFGAAWSFSSNVSTIFGYDIYNDKDIGGTGQYRPTVTIQVDINTF